MKTALSAQVIIQFICLLILKLIMFLIRFILIPKAKFLGATSLRSSWSIFCRCLKRPGGLKNKMSKAFRFLRSWLSCRLQGLILFLIIERCCSCLKKGERRLGMVILAKLEKLKGKLIYIKWINTKQTFAEYF